MDLFTRLRLLIIAGIMMSASVSAQERGTTDVALSFQSTPSTIGGGQSLLLNLDFTKGASVEEQRLVFIVELRDASDDEVIEKWVADNDELGFTGDSGTIDFSVTTPSDLETYGSQFYFAAIASPWSMNRKMVEQLESYPTDGTFTYLWSGGGYGVTQNVYYRGALICPKPSGDTTYCSGLAFETAIIGFNDYNSLYGHSYIGTMTSTQMQSFRLVWYGVTDAEKLAARAIPEYGIGLEITDFEEAQKGDFIQLWRHSGSGHNPVFISWIRNGSNEITGVRYWGSQGSTNGIGYRNEYFGESSGINSDRFYIGRLRKPRDDADYDWALGTMDTKLNPTQLSSGIQRWGIM